MTNRNGETKRVFRLFWAWQDDEEGRWLSQMARQGWHLIKGGILYTFRQGEPKQVLYRLDFRARYELNRGEYLGLFRDAGWEHVCDFGPWHYFRAAAATVAGDIYSDTHSLIGKYRRLLWVLALLGVANLIGLANDLMPDHYHTDLIGLIGIVFPILAILAVGYAIIRVWMRITKLRHSAL
jgi:hypothetical protein